MADLGIVVNDPELLRQLNEAPAPLAAPSTNLGPAVDPATAAFLNQLPGNIGSAEVKTGMPSYSANFLQGVRQPIDQAAALLAKLFPSQAANTAASTESGREAYRQQNIPGAFGTGMELAGNIAGTAPLAAMIGPEAFGTGLLPRMAASGVTGGLSGALQPVDPNDPQFWSKTGQNTLTGGGLGAATPLVLGAFSRMVNPNSLLSNDARELQPYVRMTPGQAVGGTLNRIEQGLTSVPVAGDFIKNARHAAVVDFNRGAVNQALAPIGETLEAAPGSRDAIAEMNSKINDAYNTLKPQLGWATSSPALAQLQTNLTRLQNNVALTLPQKYANEFNRDIDLLVNNRLSPGGGITGESFKAATSDLGKFGVDKASNPNSTEWERRLGQAYFQAKQYLRDAQTLANPAAGQQLGNIDNAFSHALRVTRAAGALGGEPGLFTPAQLQSSSKYFDESLRDRAFAQGQALMQNYAEAGKSVLGSTVPDSGTPFRHVVTYGVPAVIGGHALPSAMPYLAGAAGLSGITGLGYSPLARAGLQAALTPRPGAAQAVRAAAPIGAVTAPWLWGALSP